MILQDRSSMLWSTLASRSRSATRSCSHAHHAGARALRRRRPRRWCRLERRGEAARARRPPVHADRRAPRALQTRRRRPLRRAWTTCCRAWTWLRLSRRASCPACAGAPARLPALLLMVLPSCAPRMAGSAPGRTAHARRAAGQPKHVPRSANWKERNAALEEVEEMLRAAGGRIQPPPGDLISALKARAGCAVLAECSADSALRLCQQERKLRWCVGWHATV